MTMSRAELEKNLRTLRLSGMCMSLEARAMQVNSGDMNFMEGLSALVQDELDRRHSRLLERRFNACGLDERKYIKQLDWSYNPRLPRGEIFDLATLKFIDRREDVLLLGKPGTGKSHVAKALALAAVEHGYKVLYREAHILLQGIHEAFELGTIKKFKAQLVNADVLVVDDLFLRNLPDDAGSELIDVLFSRYEKASTIVTSNRPIDDWPSLLGDVVVVGPLLDRLMHHGRLLKFDGKSWRLKEAAERSAKPGNSAADED